MADPKRVIRIPMDRATVTCSPKTMRQATVCKTPLAADDTVCVNGLVTLICRKPARLISSPLAPASRVINKKRTMASSPCILQYSNTKPYSNTTTIGNKTIKENRLL